MGNSLLQSRWMRDILPGMLLPVHWRTIAASAISIANKLAGL